METKSCIGTLSLDGQVIIGYSEQRCRWQVYFANFLDGTLTIREQACRFAKEVCGVHSSGLAGLVFVTQH